MPRKKIEHPCRACDGTGEQQLPRSIKAGTFIRHDLDGISDAELLQHVPHQEMELVDLTRFKPLGEKALTAAIRNHEMPRYLYKNPMQNLDYRLYESILKHTFVGSLMSSLVRYIVGAGFKPELELVNPGEDPDENQTEIRDNQEIITKLLEVDRRVEEHEAGSDTTFRQKIMALITSCLAYNRGALIYVHDKPVKIGEKSYTEIPSHVIFADARDLDMIECDAKTMRLKAVQWRYQNELVPIQDMLYMWNQGDAPKAHNSWFYGMSLLAPLFQPAKLIRRIQGEDLPAMLETSWASLYLIIAKNEGGTAESKDEEYRTLVSNLKPGKAGVLVVEETDNVKVEKLDYTAEFDKLNQMLESLIKLCISTLGLPQLGYYDEAAANRSTAISKIQLTLKTTIEPMREWIGEAISRQWYDRWFRLLYKDDQELLGKFRIKLSWTDLHVEEWFDKLEAAIQLDQRKPILDNEFGEIVGIDNYESIIDEEAAEEAKQNQEMQMSMSTKGPMGQKNPMQQGKENAKKMGMKSGQSGNNMEMKNPKDVFA